MNYYTAVYYSDICEDCLGFVFEASVNYHGTTVLLVSTGLHSSLWDRLIIIRGK